MFSDLDSTASSRSKPDVKTPVDDLTPRVLTEEVPLPFWEKNKRKIFIGLGILLIFALVVWISVKILTPPESPAQPIVIDPGIETPLEDASSTEMHLPTDQATTTIDNWDQSLLSGELEKYNFRDFYQAPEGVPEFSFVDYSLPLNIKIDVLNYYDLSRRLELDQYLENLNKNGFSVLQNPEPKEISDFYGAYSWLSTKGIPLLITSDFLLHYHQNTIKQVFKDIEETIFYNNIHEISRSLYEQARYRYENRLSEIGNINDPILESQRLAMAYFAVALELLEPRADQIDPDSKSMTKFGASEASTFYFTILPYLQKDAAREVELIRNGREKTKSPVLLYERDYREFEIPAEYRRTEKLKNFYLASRWLNSVFPLSVKDEKCPNCLLDKDDARISLTAATFITKDFSNDQELKNRWALVYKLLSYYRGLRDDLTYRQYDEAMQHLFGSDYDPAVLFAWENVDSEANLEKLRQELLGLKFNPSLGALDKEENKPQLGFKLLADYYWPNDYIFKRLSGSESGIFTGEEGFRSNNNRSNVTLCREGGGRCNGSGLDVIALVTDKVALSTHWQINSQYEKYPAQLAKLQNDLQSWPVWHDTNYWSTLGAIETVFSTNNNQMQIYASTPAWAQRLVDTASGSWVDLQIPLASLTPAGLSENRNGLNTDVVLNDNFYIEPNYSLIKKIIADNEMINGLFLGMGINKKVPSVGVTLKDENIKLNQVAEIIKKELNNEALSSKDQDFISSFAKQYKLTEANDNSFELKVADHSLIQSTGINLMALVYELNSGKYLAVGPVFRYQESRR
ncbi:MAG: DUF3160 domain-containing protein [Patescibacteria group bacterium]